MNDTTLLILGFTHVVTVGAGYHMGRQTLRRRVQMQLDSLQRVVGLIARDGKVPSAGVMENLRRMREEI